MIAELVKPERKKTPDGSKALTDQIDTAIEKSKPRDISKELETRRSAYSKTNPPRTKSCEPLASAHNYPRNTLRSGRSGSQKSRFAKKSWKELK